MAKSFTIEPLREENTTAVISLVNSAYRGEASKKGWTTEADIIDGSERIDLEAVNMMLQLPGAVILTCYTGNELLGCVYLKREATGLYLGMLSVSPASQGMGIGKKLLEAAEDHAKAFEYEYIVMTVIDIRYELIAWYERHGYVKNGETKPFPEDEKFGRPNQPIEFVVLKKMINEQGS